MSPSSFAVVLCHGSYHTPEPYQPFLSALQENGIEAHCPQLPSSDPTKLNIGSISNPDYDRDPPPGGYPQPADDAEVIKKLLRKLIVEKSKRVILMGHSSGGFTATAAAVSELQAKNRKEGGGGIVGIFYICGFLVPVGESVHSFFQPKDGSEPVIPPYNKFHVSLPTS
jgi:pimeloyl-ACP methyl ester carboxylesterase